MLNQNNLQYGQVRSSIRDLFEFGRKRIAEVGAENVYDFSLGNPSVPSPPQVLTALRELILEEDPLRLHGYTSAAGLDVTREAIAEDLNQRFGTHYTRANLYLTCGAAAGLTIALNALLVQPDDEVILQAPFFPEYEVFTRAAGGKAVILPTEEEHFQINFPALATAVTPRTRAVILNSPNNPSGVVFTEAVLRQLAALLAEKSAAYGHPIWLISDEPYREIVYDGIAVPHMPLLYPNTLICYSYSKSLSLPGERIGYLLVPDSCERARDVFDACAGAGRALGYVCAPSLMQLLVARCASVKPDLTVYRRNRDLLLDHLQRVGYRCIQPDGAFYLMVAAPGGDAKAFSERAKEQNLLLVPGDDFHARGYLRLAYCVATDMIERSLPAFERLIRA